MEETMDTEELMEMKEAFAKLTAELEILRKKVNDLEKKELVQSNSNSLELSEIQQKLDMSLATKQELEQTLVSKDVIIQNLSRELNMHKYSEERMKANIIELEGLLSASKEELQAKLVKLDEIELKLQKKKKDKVREVATFKHQLLWQRGTLQKLHKDLSDMIKEKITLQSTVADLNWKLLKNEDLRTQLEDKLDLAEQILNRTESLLSQALFRNKELKKNHKSLEEVHHDMKRVADAAAERNLELEELLEASKLAEESIQNDLNETEVRLLSSEKCNSELQQQLNLTEKRCLGAEIKMDGLSHRLKELTTMLRNMEEENSLLRHRLSSLEDVLQAANEKERELCDALSANIEERTNIETFSAIQAKNLAEAENEKEILQTYLKSLEAKMESAEEVIESSSRREKEQVEQLIYAMEQLEHQTKAIDEIIAGNLEMTLVNESLVKDTELNLQEAAVRIKHKESEVEELHEKLKFTEHKLQEKDSELGDANEKLLALEDQLQNYEEKLSESAAIASNHKDKLTSTLLEIQNLEAIIEQQQKNLDESQSANKYLTKEKMTVESTVVNLNLQLLKNKDLRKQLEDKLDLVDEILTKTESLLSQTLLRNMDLEKNQKSPEEIHHDMRRRNLELEDLLEASKLDEGSIHKQLRETEMRLSSSKNHNIELNKQLKLAELRCHEAETEKEELKHQIEKLTILLRKTEGEISLSRHRLSDLNLKLSKDEEELRKILEDKLDMVNQILTKTESLLSQALLRNKELEKNQKSIEEMHHDMRTVVDVASMRNLELENLLEVSKLAEEHIQKDLMETEMRLTRENATLSYDLTKMTLMYEAIAKETGLKIQVASLRITEKESEVKELHEKLEFLVKQKEKYKDNAFEADKKVSLLKAELEENALKLVFMESQIEELIQKVSESHLKFEMMTGTNLELRIDLEAHKLELDELNQLLNSKQAEMEATVAQLASYEKTISKLEEDNSSLQQFQSATGTCLEVTEIQLLQTIGKLKEKDSDLRDVNEMLLALEVRLRRFEEQLSESAALSSKQKDKLTSTLSEIQNLETIIKQMQRNLEESQSANECLTKGKMALESIVVGLNLKLLKNEDIRTQLEDKLDLVDQILTKTESLLSRALMRNMEIEKKQKSVDEIHHGMRRLVDPPSKRNLELENLFEESKFTEGSIHKQPRETEMRLSSSKNRKTELNQILNLAELRCHEAETEIEELKYQAKELTTLLRKTEEENSLLRHHLSDLNLKLAKDEELRKQLEDKLDLGDQILTKTESLLSQALLHNKKLEKNQKSMKEMHHDMRTVADAALKRNLELEDLLQVSKLAEECIQKDLMETEMRLTRENLILSQDFTKMTLKFEAVAKETDLKLQVVALRISEKECEVKKLHNKVEFLEEQKAQYKDKAVENEKIIALLKDELEENAMRLVFLDNQVIELNWKVSESHLKFDMLSGTNLELQTDLEAYKLKLDKLNQLLISNHAEMEATVGRFAAYEKTISKLEDDNSGLLKLQSATEMCLKDAEVKLKEKDSELRDVNEKLLMLEVQLQNYEKQLRESDVVASSHKDELTSLYEIQNLEAIIEKQQRYLDESQTMSERLNKENLTLQCTFLDLNIRLSKNEDLHKQLEDKLDLVDQILTKTESLLSKVLLHNFELEKNQKSLEAILIDMKNLADASSKRILELEDLLEISKFTEGSIQKDLQETEMRLSSSKNRNTELNQQFNLMELRCHEAETEIKGLNHQIKELTNHLRKMEEENSLFRLHLSSLEAVLQDANEKEELSGALSASTSTEERKNMQAFSNMLAKDLAEAENIIEILKSLDARTESAKEEVEAFSHQEKEQVGKSIYGTLQLEHQGKVIDEITARNLDMPLMNETLVKDRELKFQEPALRIEQQESEVQELHEKLKFLEEQKEKYKDEAVEDNHNVASQKAELDANAMKLVFLEDQVMELNQKVSESQLKFENVDLENEMMTGTNSELRTCLESYKFKIDEVNQILRSNHAELEAAAEQFASYAKTISKLEVDNSGLLELQCTTELCLKDTEVQLHETIHKLDEKDFQLRYLNQKMCALESQLRNYEEELIESADIASNLKDKLTATLLEVQKFEAIIQHLQRIFVESNTVNECLTRENLSLSQDLTKMTLMYEALVKDTDVKVQVAALRITEKESEVRELHEKLEILEEQKAQYEDKAVEVNKTVAWLKAELEENAAKLVFLKNQVEELNQKVSESDLKFEMMTDTNSELQTVLEAYQLKLEELNDLNEKMIELDTQVSNYEEQLSESAALASNQNDILASTRSQVQNMEELIEQLQTNLYESKTENKNLTRENFSLSQDLTAHRLTIGALKIKFDSVTTEKDVISIQLYSLKEEMEALKQQLNSDTEMLQLQITTSLKEKNKLTEMHRMEMKEVEAIIMSLEGQLSEYKTREVLMNTHMENLKAELANKSLVENQVSEHEQKLLNAERSHMKEIEGMGVTLEKQALLASEINEHTSIVEEREDLLQQLKKVQNELFLTHRTIEEQVREGNKKHALINVNLTDLRYSRGQTPGNELNVKTTVNNKIQEVNSRGFGLGSSTFLHRSERDNDCNSQGQRFPLHPITQDEEDLSRSMALKFVSAVALLSMIAGIILGKRY